MRHHFLLPRYNATFIYKIKWASDGLNFSSFEINCFLSKTHRKNQSKIRFCLLVFLLLSDSPKVKYLLHFGAVNRKPWFKFYSIWTKRNPTHEMTRYSATGTARHEDLLPQARFIGIPSSHSIAGLFPWNPRKYPLRSNFRPRASNLYFLECQCHADDLYQS